MEGIRITMSSGVFRLVVFVIVAAVVIAAWKLGVAMALFELIFKLVKAIAG